MQYEKPSRYMEPADAQPAAPVVARNRRNAQLSTGPRSPEGKALVRMNALKHGLTANPASAFGEDAEVFEALLEQLGDELDPRDQVEAALVHRIAVCLWRLQRAASVDAAVSTRRVTGCRVPHHRTHEYIGFIHDAWKWKEVRELDDKLIARARELRLARPGEPWMRHKRTAMEHLDGLGQQMMEEPEGIEAMMVVLDELAEKLFRGPDRCRDEDLEKLGWILGDSTENIPACLEEVDPGLKRRMRDLDLFPTQRGVNFELLLKARDRRPLSPFPPDVQSALDAKRQTLEDSLSVLRNYEEVQSAKDARTAALLPDAKTLDRLIRYETHAERSLVRCLKTFAELRGVKVEVIKATITARRQG